MDLLSIEYEPMVGCCLHGNEPFDSINVCSLLSRRRSVSSCGNQLHGRTWPVLFIPFTTKTSYQPTQSTSDYSHSVGVIVVGFVVYQMRRAPAILRETLT
jgi:hypothetical protein